MKDATSVDTSKLAASSNLVSLKAEVDIVNVDKLKTFPADESKLSNSVDNDVVKNNVHNKSVARVNLLILVDLF